MSISIVHNEPAFVTCPHCRGDESRQRNTTCGFCEECCNAGEVAEDLSALATLAHNIAMGAALCRAHRLGRAWQAEYLTAQWNGGGWTYPFEPGCGREAP